MHLFRKSIAVRVPVRLVDGSGNPVTGVTPTDVHSGVCTVIKADGTTADITLSLGVNFFEFSPAAKSRGLYHVLIPNTMTNVIGPIQWVVLPAASVFSSAGYVGTGVVEDLPALVMSYIINSDGAAVANSAAAALRLIALFLTGRVKQDSATNTMTIYKEDGTTPLVARDTLNAAGDPASDPVYEVTP